MTRRLQAVLLAAAAAAIAGQVGAQARTQRGPQSNADVRTSIEAANKKYFMEAAPKGDAALIAPVYTEDAVAYPANSEAVKAATHCRRCGSPSSKIHRDIWTTSMPAAK